MGETNASIVMTYFERPIQLLNTLRSFAFHGYGPDIEVVIVDDGSVEHPAAKIAGNFDFRIKHIYLDPEKKWYCNPCIPFNIGFTSAMGQIIIMQNAECFHYDNVVEHALNKVSSKNYITYSCYSQAKNEYEKILELKTFEQIREEVVFDERIPMNNGESGWYNHSKYKPRAFHFCAAITKENLERLNGFDRFYAKGNSFDDTEFLFRIRNSGLNVEIVDTVSVVHQWHYVSNNYDATYHEQYRRNKILYSLFTRNRIPTLFFPSYYYITTKLSMIRNIIKLVAKRILSHLIQIF